MPANIAGSDHPINGYSIFTLIVFFGVNILVIFPLHIPISRAITRPLRKTAVRLRILTPLQTLHTGADENGTPRSRAVNRSQPNNDSTIHSSASSTTPPSPPVEEEPLFTFQLGLSTAPVIGVLLLLATTSIPGSVVRDGIVGSQGVRPYDIMTLFLSLAYISLSLDCTGLLRFLAFWVAVKGGTNGRRLYLYFFLFFFGSGVLVGNDPIILSGTSFLAYFSRIAGISPPRAWLFSQFSACNVASAVLVSSNPTNLVLTGAFGISFLVYSAWLILPVLATALILFPWLVLGWFNDPDLIPPELESPGVDPETALIDREGAIFGSLLLGVTLVALVGLSAAGLLEGIQGVWTVTAPAACVMVMRDLWYDRAMGRWASGGGGVEEPVHMEKRSDVVEQGKSDLDGPLGRIEGGDEIQLQDILEDQDIADQVMDGIEFSRPTDMRRRLTSGGAGHGATPSLIPARGSSPATDARLTTPTSIISLSHHLHSPRSLQSLIYTLSHRIPTFSHVFVHLPLPLLPFAFSMFVLVGALQSTGWMRVFAAWWASWVERTGVAGAIWLMGCLSVLGCNIFGTNIGATILLSRMMQQWEATHGNVSQRVLYASVYTLAIGSNYGAFSYTFSASLAGLLWKDILLQKGIKVGRWEFMKNNGATVVICMVVGGLVVAGEVMIMLQD